MTMAQHGALPNGGCCRLALSDDDKEGRDLFVSWAIEAGCEIILDQAGNIIARRPGIDANAKPVATGSHLDTQPHGGKFDGIYGVLAGLEAVRAMNDADIQTQRPIDIVVFTNEEGARFTPPLTGSLAYAGSWTLLRSMPSAPGMAQLSAKTLPGSTIWVRTYLTLTHPMPLLKLTSNKARSWKLRVK